MTRSRHDRRPDSGTVLTRDVRDLPGASIVRQPPGGDGLGGLRNLVLGVEAVAEHGPGKTALGEGLLGREVAGPDHRRVGRPGVETGGVDDVPDAYRRCGGDRRAMLLRADLDVRRADSSILSAPAYAAGSESGSL